MIGITLRRFRSYLRTIAVRIRLNLLILSSVHKTASYRGIAAGGSQPFRSLSA